MARQAKVRWCPAARAWRSDVGPKNAAGRRAPRYFRARPLPGGGEEELGNTPAGQRKAQDLLDAYLRGRDRDEARADADARDPLLHEVVTAYLAHVEATKAPRTWEGYRDRLQAVQAVVGRDGVPLGLRRVGSLTAEDGARMVAGWVKRGLSGTYITNGLLLSAKACLNWAAAVDHAREPRQILAANPWDALRGPDAGEAERRLVERDELAAFLRQAWAQANEWHPDANKRCAGCRRSGTTHRTRNKATGAPEIWRCPRSHSPRQALARATVLLVRCQYHCGTRPGELCKARWDGWEPRDWRDPETGEWYGMLRMVGKNTKRKKRLREIPVPPLLTRAIERLRSGPYRHEEYVFARPSKPRGATGAGRPRPAEAGPPPVTPWASSSELARRIRLWRIGGLPLARAAEERRLVRAGVAPAEAAARAAALRPPYDPGLTLYTLRHTYYTDAIEGGETFERAGAVGDTGAATIEKTYFRHRKRSRFETAKRIRRVRKQAE